MFQWKFRLSVSLSVSLSKKKKEGDHSSLKILGFFLKVGGLDFSFFLSKEGTVIRRVLRSLISSDRRAFS